MLKLPSCMSNIFKISDKLQYLHCSADVICHLGNLAMISPPPTAGRRFSLQGEQLHQQKGRAGEAGVITGKILRYKKVREPQAINFIYRSNILHNFYLPKFVVKYLFLVFY